MTATDAQKLHADAIVIDGTCPLLNDPDYISWWVEGGVTAAAPTIGGFDNAAVSLRKVGAWIKRINDRPDLLLVKSAADIERAKLEGRFGIIFHFQGTEPIEDDLNLVDAYKALGVGMIQLAYNTKNRVGDGAEERTDAGLSRFGLRLIERMNQAKVIVDCSHTGYRTTMEAIEASTAPVVFSHANSKVLKPSNRNIGDDQVKAIAATGGLVGAVGFPAFVSDDPKPTLDQFINHIVHFASLVGTDHIGIGIDYFSGQEGVASLDSAQKTYDAAIADGMWRPENYPPPPYFYPAGIEVPQGFPNLTTRMLERGFSQEDTSKILGGNWLRVFRTVWGE